MHFLAIASLAAILAACASCKAPKTDRGSVSGIDYGDASTGAGAPRQGNGGPGTAQADTTGNGQGNTDGSGGLPTSGAPGNKPGNTTGAQGNNGTAGVGNAPTTSGSSASSTPRTNGTSTAATTASTTTSPSRSIASTQPPPAPACQTRAVKSADWGKDQVDCWSKPSEGTSMAKLANGTAVCFDLTGPQTVQAFPRPYDLFRAPKLNCWVESKHIEM